MLSFRVIERVGNRRAFFKKNNKILKGKINEKLKKIQKPKKVEF